MANKREVAIGSVKCHETIPKYSTGKCRLEIYLNAKLKDTFRKTIKMGDEWKLDKSYKLDNYVVVFLWHEDSHGKVDFIGYVYINRDLKIDVAEIFKDINKTTPKLVIRILKDIYTNSPGLVGDISKADISKINKKASGWFVPKDIKYSLSYSTTGEPESHAFDVYIPGQLLVSIEPQAAVEQGGQYRLSDGDWMNAEEILTGIKPGQYLLSFKKLDKWDNPKEIPIFIPGGGTTQVSVFYNSIPDYAIGSIPTQTIWQGDELRFLVHNQEEGLGSNLSISANPQPRGEISFNPNSCLFSYTPAPEDKEEFKVTFQATEGGSQTISIIPMNKLSPEVDILDYSRPLPDPECRDYIVVQESTNPEEPFNHLLRETHNVAIAGPTIIFESGCSKNDLYEIYNGRQDIHEMQIFAENVIIRSPLHLPQTNVTIRARTLKFEDLSSADPGSAQINTTAETLSIVPEQGDGEHGPKAGNITLIIESCSSGYYTDYKRFNLVGGKGQSASMGQNGADGGSEMDSRDQLLTGGEIVKVVWHRELDGTFDFGVPDENSEWGRWPANGDDAVGAGKPGNGGSGGNVQSTLDITPLVDNGGGIAGLSGPNRKGGKAQKPIISYGLYRVKTGGSGGHIEYDELMGPNESKDGRDFLALYPDVPIGANGNVTLLDQQPWVSPLALETILSYLRETYIDGHYAFVELTCNKFLAILSASEEKASEELLTDLNASKQEFTDLRNRIDNKLDYFGNPAGWTPMLSFEANKIAFENEIDAAIPILYLTYWLGDAAAKAENAREAMINALNTIKSELPNKINRFNQIQILFPGLVTERTNLMRKVQTLEISISNREQELLATAEDNLQVEIWRTGLRIIGSVLKVVPVYQPALGAVGTGMDLLSNIDTEKPLESLWESRDILKEYDAELLEKTSKEFSTKLNAIQTSNYSDLKKNAKELQLIGKQLSPAIDGIKKALKEREVPRSEIEAELESLKATDPVYIDLVKEVQQYLDELGVFVEQISNATAELIQLVADIQSYLLAGDAIQENLASVSEKLNPRTLSYIKMMERRTKDRLLKYQYFLGKAYNYRMLKPYDGDLKLNHLFDSFVSIGEDNNGILPTDEFPRIKGVYEEELRRITGIMLEELNTTSPERSVPITVGLTPEEIDKLNFNGEIQINLVDKKIFGKTEENLRLVNIKTNNISVHPDGGSYGSTAILRINILHTGLSQLSSRGKTYLFRHYRTGSTNPITWKSVFDGITGITSETKLSAASESLLDYLLGESGGDDDLVLYSRPAAWADLVIKKEVSTDNGIDMVIDSFRLEVQYDYFEEQSNQVELTVETQGTLDPNIFLNVTDLNGRRDGRGNFRRVFNRNQVVILQAQPTYGKWKFEKWTDEIGNTLSSGTPVSVIEIVLDDDKEVHPIYL